MSLDIRAATETDLPRLAEMNKHLFEDAGSHNPMTVEALHERMAAWLASGEWNLVVVTQDAQVFGYAVYQTRPDAYEPTITFVYIRQFFIDRDWRRKGLGRSVFDTLLQTHFPEQCKVVIDALADDRNAQAFWSSLSFEPYSVTMMLHHYDDA